MTRKDWTLLVIAAADEAGLDPVQLQKSLFLLGERGRQHVGSAFYKFVPHNYGPFCHQVYTDAAALAADGFISKERRAGNTWASFAITPLGKALAGELRRRLAVGGDQFLDQTVAWVKSLSFHDLVQSIYRHYPEYRVNSVFRG
jgi:hypothetical protein